MSKDLIRNKDGKVKLCNSNIAKFNVFEYVKYSNKSFLDFLFPVVADKHDFMGLVRILAFISQVIPLWGIVSYFQVRGTIKRAKSEVEKNKKRKL